MGSWKWRLMERMYLVVMAKSLSISMGANGSNRMGDRFTEKGVQGTERPGY